MGFIADYLNRYVPASYVARGDWVGALKTMTPLQFIEDLSGYSQYKNTQNSTQTQIDYNNYLKGGNARALVDWQKNVGSQGRTIKYPELSYAGQMYRADTASTRAMFDADTAGSNFFGNLPYRAGGLYGISSRLSRSL